MNSAAQVVKGVILHSTLLHSTLLYPTLLHSTLLYSSLLDSAPLHSTLLYSALKVVKGVMPKYFNDLRSFAHFRTRWRHACAYTVM